MELKVKYFDEEYFLHYFDEYIKGNKRLNPTNLSWNEFFKDVIINEDAKEFESDGDKFILIKDDILWFESIPHIEVIKGNTKRFKSIMEPITLYSLKSLRRRDEVYKSKNFNPQEMFYDIYKIIDRNEKLNQIGI